MCCGGCADHSEITIGKGSSFTVCCSVVLLLLQVQQALLQQNWPSAVTYNDDWEGAASILDCRSASSQQAAGPEAVEADEPSHHSRGSLTWQGEEAEAAAAPRAPHGKGSPQPARSSNSFTQAQQQQVSQRTDSTLSGATNSSSTGFVVHAAGGSGAGNARQLSGTSADSRSPWFWGRASSPSMLAPAAALQHSYVSSVAGAPMGGSGSSKKHAAPRPRNMWLFQQLLAPRAVQQKLFCGLRVRMGVVTGIVERGQDLKSSDLYRHAQGGQGAG